MLSNIHRVFIAENARIAGKESDLESYGIACILCIYNSENLCYDMEIIGNVNLAE
jgi:hypothetical protein